MKKIILFTLFLLTCQQAQASHPLEGWCVNKSEPKDLEFWIKKNAEDGGNNAVILTGNILEVRLTYNGHQDGTCWARMQVTEWLRGKTDQKIWVAVKVGDPAVNIFGNAFKDLSYCELKKDYEYLIYGRKVDFSDHERTLEKSVVIFSSRVSNELLEKGFYCPPHIRLKHEYKDIILDYVRKIIKKTEGK